MSETISAFPESPVLVLGGTGFVGRVLVRALTRAGFSVTVPSRHAFRHRDMNLWPRVRLCDMATQADSDVARARRAITLADLMPGHPIVINLVGILTEPRHNGDGFAQAHLAWTQQILTLAAQCGVRQYLHMSALGADALNGSSFYLRSKGAAADWAHQFGAERGIVVASFRPSVIFGAGDAFLNRFARLAAWMPGLFPLACADARFSPVFVGDVAAQFLAAIGSAQVDGQRMDLCGPADYTLRELVEYAARLSGHPRWVLKLPDWAARWQAVLMEHMPGKPFTRDQFDSLQTPSVCPEGCPRQLTRLERVAPGYLGADLRSVRPR